MSGAPEDSPPLRPDPAAQASGSASPPGLSSGVGPLKGKIAEDPPAPIGAGAPPTPAPEADPPEADPPDGARRTARGEDIRAGAIAAVPGRAAVADPGRARAIAPVFLEREPYRRRRLMDAARLLPALGTALLMLPMLWDPDHRTGGGLIYLLLVWLGIIGVSAFLARRLSEPLRHGEAPGEAGRGE